MFVRFVRRILAVVMCMILVAVPCLGEARAELAESDAATAEAAAPVEVPSEAPESAPAPAETTPDSAPAERSGDASAPAAAESPEAAPAESPESAPAAAPAENPESAPVAAPAENPESAPVAAPAEVPENTPTAAPEESPESTSTAAPAESPENAPTAAPAESPENASAAAPAESPENASTAAPAESPESTSTIAPSEVPENTSTIAPSESPEVTPTATIAPLSVAELPDFQRGYVRLRSGTAGYASAAPDAAQELYLEGGVAYALSRRTASGTDRLECAFDDGAGERHSWIDANALIPMEQEEIARFIEARLAEPEPRFLAEDAALPLGRVTCGPVVVYALSAEASATPTPEIPAMLVGQTELVLGEGEKFALDVRFSDGMAHGLGFAARNTRIAKVNAAGQITAKKRGSTIVLIRSEYGNEAYVKVTVKKAPKKLALGAARTKLGVGERLVLWRGLTSGSASQLRFASSNAGVVAVDGDGTVCALAPGDAKITARTYNGKKASVILHVDPAPEGVTLESALVLGVGQAALLAPQLSAGSSGACAFSCGDADVLELNPETGAIRALALGQTTVTVRTYNGCEASCAVTVKPAPSCVSLASTGMVLGVGEWATMPEVRLGAPGEDCMGNYAFKSSNKKIVKVGADGSMRAVRTGSATITVYTHNGCTAKLKVYVKRAPGSVKLNAKYLVLGAGEEATLTAKLPAKTAGSVRFESSNPEVATVDAAGHVQALKQGEAIVTAVSYNGKRARCGVFVKRAPEGISLSQSTLTLGVGQVHALSAALPEGSVGAYSFSVADGNVVAVDARSGAIRALALGQTTVTVRTYNGCEASCAVTVKPAPSCVSLASTGMVLGVGEWATMPEVRLGAPGEDCMGNYAFKSSNKKCVKVGADGSIRAVRTGSATITVYTHNGCTAKLKVYVKRAPGSVKLNAKYLVLGTGEEATLTAKLPAKTAGSVRFESSNPEVATVDAAGHVQAIKQGEAIVTAVSYNGKRARCGVFVKRAPEGVSLSKSALTLGVGEVYWLSAVLPEGSAGACSFSVADENVAIADASRGAVKGLAPGQTTVTVRTYNGCEASCALTVLAAPTGIAFQERGVVLLAKDKYKLLPPVLGGEGAGCGGLIYKSSNKKIMKVGADGTVYGVRKGKAKLTVYTYNGRKASIWVYVKDAPKGIAFVNSEASMIVDERLVPEMKPVSGAAYSYTLASSNPDVAYIDGGRTVCAVRGGEAVITATAYNGKMASFRLKVWDLPTSVQLKPSALKLGAGDSAKLTPVLPEGQASAFSYESSDPAVAEVNADGEVRARNPGSATIRVRTQNGLESTCDVRVFKAPSSIHLSPGRAWFSLDEGGFQLRVTLGGPEEGGRYAFSSSDEAVATVSAKGYVTLRGVGAATISVTSYNRLRADCVLNVGQRPTAMSFAQPEYAVALGDSVHIAPVYEAGCESYRLESSNPEVFAVSGDHVRALQMGSATLTAISRSGLTASCTLVTAPAPTGIQLKPMSAVMVMGANATLQLSASALPNGVGSVHFISSNPEIASVDYESGLVTAHAKGNCTITAATYDGQYGASCAIEVRKLLEGVKIGIDPGHQAKGDPSKESSSPKGGRSKPKVSDGATGRKTRIKEHKTNLRVGLKLRDALEALGAEVYMTRETANVNISNKQRAKMMNKYGVDLVLRLHCNSSDSSSTNGIMLYIRKTCAYGWDVVDGAALLAAEKRLAKALMWEMPKATGAKGRKIVRNDNYTGNNWSIVPCVLVEMGYNSNPTEDKRLNNPEYQDKLVRGMINGICLYLGRDYPAQ